MGGLNVKNTMIERVLQVVAPHPCSGCGKVGSILCDDCKYDITHEPFWGCILCGTPNPYGICATHDSPIARAFTVGSRGGVLETIVNKLKFEHVKASALPLAQLLHIHLPLFPAEVIVVPIPTVNAHVRQRGYDQVELIVRHFCHLRGLSFDTVLERISTATQHTVGRKAREQQSQAAFRLRRTKDLRGQTIVLVDDIVTTGSTLVAAATLLSEAGAIVWVATLAYQPLD